MSCSGENSFGYLEVTDDKVISYTGDRNRPEIHKFCNDEIVQAVKLKKAVEKWLDDSDVPNHGDWTFHNLTKLLEESKK